MEKTIKLNIQDAKYLKKTKSSWISADTEPVLLLCTWCILGGSTRALRHKLTRVTLLRLIFSKPCAVVVSLTVIVTCPPCSTIGVAEQIRECLPATRSKGQVTDSEPIPISKEYDYPGLLNRCLPDEIRVVGWCDVDSEFSARGSAQWREYKYYIVDAGQYNLQRMREGAQHLVGTHDFRHFCKVDVSKNQTFVRQVLFTSVDPVLAVSCWGRRILQITIKSTAFLWHQVRCIASVLILVGQGLEQPSVIAQLLDIETNPRKPEYQYAAPEPLMLYDCGFQDLHFHRTQTFGIALCHIQELLNLHIVKTMQLAMTLHNLQQVQFNANGELPGIQLSDNSEQTDGRYSTVEQPFIPESHNTHLNISLNSENLMQLQKSCKLQQQLYNSEIFTQDNAGLLAVWCQTKWTCKHKVTYPISRHRSLMHRKKEPDLGTKLAKHQTKKCRREGKG